VGCLETEAQAGCKDGGGGGVVVTMYTGGTKVIQCGVWNVRGMGDEIMKERWVRCTVAIRERKTQTQTETGAEVVEGLSKPLGTICEEWMGDCGWGAVCRTRAGDADEREQ